MTTDMDRDSIIAQLQRKIRELIALYQKQAAEIDAHEAQNGPVQPTNTPTMQTTSQRLLQSAKSHIGRHLTLDPSVPPDLGCAEAVSFLLRDSGFAIPNGGFPGTAALNTWIKNSNLFIKTITPQPGAIVMCATGTSSKNDPHGHVGILIENSQISSNDSDTGLFATKYTVTSWIRYFSTINGFPTVYWQPK